MTDQDRPTDTSGRRATKDADHVPVEKRLSGDFKSPVELMAAHGLKPDQKREILDVWLGDLETQPDSDETRQLRESILETRASLDEGHS